MAAFKYPPLLIAIVFAVISFSFKALLYSIKIENSGFNSKSKPKNRKEIKTYTKKDIATELSKRQNKSVRSSITIVDDLFRILKDYLTEDNPYTRIEVRNFGVFESKPTKAKPRARNPRTNEEIYVPAHKKTRFKPGKYIKEQLRKPI